MKNRGFSLIEVLVFTAILSATTLALATIIFYSFGIVNSARAKSNQRQLAEMVQDRLRNAEVCRNALQGQAFTFSGSAERPSDANNPDISQRFRYYNSGSPVRIDLRNANVGLIAPGSELIPTMTMPNQIPFNFRVRSAVLLDAAHVGDVATAGLQVYNVALWAQLERIDGRGTSNTGAAGTNVLAPVKLADFSVFVNGSTIVSCQAFLEFKMAACGADRGQAKMYLPSGYGGVPADANGCVPVSAFNSTPGANVSGPPGLQGPPGAPAYGPPGAPGNPGQLQTITIPPPPPPMSPPKTSDARVKVETGEFEYGLAEVLKIRPIWFRYNGLAGTVAGEKHAGVIAQELEKIAPKLVETLQVPLSPGEKEKSVKAVRYDEINMMLIRAVQEQQEILKKLNEKLDSKPLEAGTKNQCDL